MCILRYKSDFKSGRLSVDYLWTNCPLLVVYVGLGQPFHEVNKGVNEVNCRRTPDCDSGCRGFEPRFSPHFLKDEFTILKVPHYANYIRKREEDSSITTKDDENICLIK